ncbi:MAG: NAD(P)H-binding protein [Alphaproteobacteria bacterium]|nr:NAD(P)H-binding protein [Alphaproteobacteria bacterium]
MSSQPILVTGATGKTGSRIVSKLRSRGYTVRPGSRSSIIPFDWDAPETWADALSGVAAVYVCFQPDFAFPGALETLAAFAQAACEAGIARAVMLTGRGEPHALRGEAILREAGFATTILRSAWFAQNFSEGSLRDAVLDGVLALPGGDIREPIIDLDDLADVAVASLTEPGHEGQVYELTGPRLLSFAEAAEILSQASGRRVTHLPVSFDDFHAHLAKSAGEPFARTVTDIARETFDGRNAHVTGGVERALGRSPRDFADFAARAAKDGAWAALPACP